MKEFGRLDDTIRFLLPGRAVFEPGKENTHTKQLAILLPLHMSIHKNPLPELEFEIYVTLLRAMFYKLCQVCLAAFGTNDFFLLPTLPASDALTRLKCL